MNRNRFVVRTAVRIRCLLEQLPVGWAVVGNLMTHCCYHKPVVENHHSVVENQSFDWLQLPDNWCLTILRCCMRNHLLGNCFAVPADFHWGRGTKRVRYLMAQEPME